MPQILREFQITENGKPAENLGYISCRGISTLRAELKRLRKVKPQSEWAFIRGDRYRLMPNGTTRNIDK